jgi:hypothetical protein
MKNFFNIIFIGIFSLSLSAQSAAVKGSITDAENNEPLPFANIVVEGTQIGTTSDLDGNFTITGLEPGFIRLVASYLGYETTTSEDILLSNNNVPFIEMKLLSSSQLINEVVISVDKFEKRQESPISMQSIGLKEIESNPGSNRDISRVIQSFPGVGSTPAFRNDVIIRGGGPSENRFFLDDVEIPVLNHFSTQGASGGPVGIINADFIKSVDFYSGSFPADKYNALSGVFDFKQKEGNMDKTNIQGAIGASEASLTLDGPLGDKTSYIFSVRRSYLQFLFSAIGLPFLPTFNDYQLKVKTKFNQKNQFTLISIGSLDNLTLNTSIEDPDPSQEYILEQIPVNNQWSYTIGGVYKNFFDTGSHTFVMSRNMLNNQIYKHPENDESLPRRLDYLSREIENKLRYELSFRDRGVKYTFSSNFEFAKYENDTKQQVFVNGQNIDFSYISNFNLYKYGFSAQASKRFFNERLLTSLGLRSDANSYNDNMSNLVNQLSPRLSFSFNINNSTLLNAGVGRYFQLPAYTTLGYRDAENELVNAEGAKYIGANHINLGLEKRFSKEVLLSVEGFYKDYFQYPIDLQSGSSLANSGAGYEVAGAVPVGFEGSGRAVGFEVLNRVNMKSFTLLASYTFVRSEFTNLEEELIPSSWDSKHLLTITGSKDFKKNWRAGFKWRFVGGLPYTPYDLDKSANVFAWNAIGQPYLDFNRLNGERFEPFHQLDFRVDKNFFFNRWSLMVYLDIQNAYNFQNKSQDFIVRERNEDGSFNTTDNGTNYILNRIPNESGTILPTVGIMVKF